jgi:hypothetical protein
LEEIKPSAPLIIDLRFAVSSIMTLHDQYELQQQDESSVELQEQAAFLDCLSKSSHISIRLLERRDPENFLQGIFTLELDCDCQVYSDDTDTETNAHQHHSFVDTQKGIRDPNCSWPVYTFLVDESQSDFLWNKVLPAVRSAATSGIAPTATRRTSQLQTLTLQGLGRVPGLYTELMQCLAASQSLTTLSILNWTDFISSLGDDCSKSNSDSDSLMLLLVPVLSRLEHFSVTYPKVVFQNYNEKADCSRTAEGNTCAGPSRDLLCRVLSTMTQLRTLRIETGTIHDPFWSDMQQALDNVTHLEELVWTGRVDTTTNNEQLGLGAESHEQVEIFERLCHTIGSMRRLLHLKLNWNRLPSNAIEALLACCNGNLRTLEISNVDNGGGLVLGDYLQGKNSLGLTKLNVTFASNCYNVTQVLEGVVRHTGLREVSLSNVHMDNDVAKTTLMLFTYNNCLQHFSLSSSNMESRFLEDMLMGLKFNASLQVVDFPDSSRLTTSSKCILDIHCSVTLQDLLIHNTTLRYLNLGLCQIATDECAHVIAQGIMVNETLQSFYGLDLGSKTAVTTRTHTTATPLVTTTCTSNTIVSILIDALQHNTSLVHFSLQPCSPTNITRRCCDQPELKFYLDLNQMGRKHFLNTTFDIALLPHVLATAGKHSVDHIHYILQARVDLFQRT